MAAAEAYKEDLWISRLEGVLGITELPVLHCDSECYHASTESWHLWIKQKKKTSLIQDPYRAGKVTFHLWTR